MVMVDHDPAADVIADLLDAIDVVVWRADAQTLRFKFVSRRAEALLGHSRERWLSDPEFWDRHTMPDESPRLAELFRSSAREGQPCQCVHRMRTADGQIRWFQTTVRPCAPAPSTDIAGIMLDLTERRVAEVTLTETETRLRLIFDQLPAIAWTVDRELRFTSGIGRALAPLGLSPDKTLMNVSVHDYFQTRDPDHPAIRAHRRALEGEAVSYEVDWGGHSFSAHVEPFRDHEGTLVGAIGVALDVTERKKLERQREELLVAETRAREAAEQAVHVRDEFLSIASHELRTPVTSVLLGLQALMTRPPDEPMASALVRVAEAQARRLKSLIDDLLDVVRIQAGRLTCNPELVDVSRVAREVIARYEAQINASASPVTLHAEPVPGMFDPSWIDQIVSNLLSNAIKYGNGNPIEVTVARVDGRVQLRVEDRGIGIPADRLPHIFERFERAVPGRHYGGLGIGLYIVRRLVDTLHGTIRVESELGRGSHFTVDLPLGEQS
jgi:PAS domain S-box-containing protein